VNDLLIFAWQHADHTMWMAEGHPTEGRMYYFLQCMTCFGEAGVTLGIDPPDAAYEFQIGPAS
jgi:hypothetical protein